MCFVVSFVSCFCKRY